VGGGQQKEQLTRDSYYSLAVPGRREKLLAGWFFCRVSVPVLTFFSRSSPHQSGIIAFVIYPIPLFRSLHGNL